MPSNNNTNGRNMSQNNKYNYKNKNNKDAANYQICRLIELLDKKHYEDTIKKKFKIVNINTSDIKIDKISDIINLTDNYPYDKQVRYNIDINMLHKIRRPLKKMNDMIGMENIKATIVNQILYYLQNFHKISNKLSFNDINNGEFKSRCNKYSSYNTYNRSYSNFSIQNDNNDYLHTVIYGPPGTGKTEIARLIADIFSRIGILKRNYFKKVTRSDLIAGYLGQTAIKTKDVIKDCLGGVLFIDEAYALGNAEGRDSFSKECIDTICESLSYYKDDLMVIIAGYKQELDTCFFSYNKGLESRFTWSYETEKYSGQQLHDILVKKISESGWKSDFKFGHKWFEKNKDNFVSFGRDMETLFMKAKICHSKRVFGLSDENKSVINDEDIENAYKMFLDNKKNEAKTFNNNMYI
jgi:SpoVK/Ycf46/Vps4 family AAA+-type ATPase